MFTSSSRSARRRLHLTSLTLLAGALTTSTLGAQNARVITASTGSRQILEVEFGGSGATATNTDPGTRERLASVRYRDDGAAGVHALVADDLAGQVLYYDDAVGVGQVVLDAANPGDPQLPGGLSLDPNGNLYGLYASGQAGGVWVLRRNAACMGASCRPGGYEGPVGYIDTSFSVGSGGAQDRLAETLVVTSSGGALAAGDLLVLSSAPATVLRYRAADLTTFLDALAMGMTPAELVPDVFIHPPGAAVPANQQFPAGAGPVSMTIEPGGRLLISSTDGTVYSFENDGTRSSSGGSFVDFLTGLAPARHGIVAGYQDGQPRAFLSVPHGDRVERYTIQADGTGVLDATVTNVPRPFAIGTITSSVANTPAGSGITVATSNLMTSRIANVVVSGNTSVREFVFTDPREAEVPTPVGQPLHRSLFLDEISALLPVGIEIPAWVRAMRKDDPVSGPPTFILLVVDTNYEILGPVNHEAQEDLVLGYTPDCEDPDPTLRPRLFWVPNLDEPPSPEFPRFINVSSGCGSVALNKAVRSKGVTRRFSLFLIGARDTRPWNVIAQEQFDGLAAVLASSGCVSPAVLAAIQSELTQAQANFAILKLQPAIANLQNLVAIVQQNPLAFAGCSENEGGGLVARALATIFNLTEADGDTGNGGS